MGLGKRGPRDGTSQDADLARAFYAALAAGDGLNSTRAAHPDSPGSTAEGMPFGIGGEHDGPPRWRRNAWGAIARHFEARAEPDRFSISLTALARDRPLSRPGQKHGGAPSTQPLRI